jgi:haloalkane dehalogenase
VLEALRTDERPKLHLWADADPIIPPKVGERFAAAINAEPPEIIDNASHFLQEDAGDRLGTRIAEWLNDHPARRSETKPSRAAVEAPDVRGTTK